MRGTRVIWTGFLEHQIKGKCAKMTMNEDFFLISFVVSVQVDNLRPNPSDLLPMEGMDVDSDTGRKAAITDAYRPTRLASAHYDSVGVDARNKREEIARRRLSKSRIMQDLADEFRDEPEERREMRSGSKKLDDEEVRNVVSLRINC